MMKKLIFATLLLFTITTITSCDAYSHAVCMSNEGITYEYTYNTYPVRYFNGIPYYYAPYNNHWCWSVIERPYRSRIIHHAPTRYVNPHRYQQRRPMVRQRQMRRGNFRR